MKKVVNVLNTIFAYGIIACLFAGGMSLVGYIAGLVIGGEIATALCAWVFKTYLPWVIKATSVIAGIGLVSMYLSKQEALTVTVEKK